MKGEYMQMKKTNRRKEEGITLIILVVTIVVILLLAGITMDLAFDENGIIKRAMGLQEIVNQSVANEERELDALTNQLDSTLTNFGIGGEPTVNDITGGGGESEVPQKPNITINGIKGEGGNYRSDVELIVTASDRSNTLTYTVEGTGIEEGSVHTETSIENGQSIQITQDGTFSVTVYAYNKEGKKSEGMQVEITRDTVAPGIIPIEAREAEGIKAGEISSTIIITPTETPVNIEQSKFIPIDESGNAITDVNTHLHVSKGEDEAIHLTITGGNVDGKVNVEVQAGAIKDLAGNENEKITIETNVIVDNTAPTVKTITGLIGRTDGFSISINAVDNEGGIGLAEENTYTIYYRRKGDTEYQSVTTNSNKYSFTGLTPIIEKSQINSPKLKEGMNPVMWVDLNGDGEIEEATEEIMKYTDLSTKTINPVWNENDGDNQWCSYTYPNGTYEVYATVKDKNGNVSANSPMVKPFLYKIDHRTGHWGNVKMEEDGSYFVWIPRYAYGVIAKGSQKAGMIDVKFINGTGNTAYDGTTCTIATSNSTDSTKQYVVHPAFCENVNMGGYETNLEGIWVAKYEASREDSADGITWAPTTETTGGGNYITTNAGNADDEKIRVVSKPNVRAWGNIQISHCYKNAYNYNRGLDSHLIKNSEWRSRGLFNA